MTQGEKIDKIYDTLNIVVTNQAVTSEKIDVMNTHLIKLNDKVQTNANEIDVLEKTTVSKSWMRRLGIFIVGIPSVLWVVLQIINYLKL